MKENGWDVDVLCLAKIINPEAANETITGLMSPSEVIEIKTVKEYKIYINNLKEAAIFVFFRTFSLPVRFLVSSLRKEDKYGVFFLNMYEVRNVNYEIRLKNYLKNVSFRKIIASIYIRMPYWLLELKQMDFVAVCGEYHEKNLPLGLPIGDNTKINQFPSISYNKCMETAKYSQRLIGDKYCVFLDQYIPWHPDWEQLGIKVSKEMEESYHRELREMFSYIEKNYGMKVVIASHPKGDYEKHPEAFKGFEIIRFKTTELVCGAEFVMAHSSGSISDAIILHKPVVYINNNMFHTIIQANGIEFYEQINACANEIGADVINASERRYLDYDFSSVRIDEEKYTQIIRNQWYGNYNTDLSNPTPLWDQINEFLHELSGE
jgi:Holliday junction resolvase